MSEFVPQESPANIDAEIESNLGWQAAFAHLKRTPPNSRQAQAEFGLAMVVEQPFDQGWHDALRAYLDNRLYIEDEMRGDL